MWSTASTSLLRWAQRHVDLGRSPGAYVLDKDGTLVTEGRAVPGAAALLAHVAERRLPCVVLSNTGERSGAAAGRDLVRLLEGCVAVPPVLTAHDHLEALLLACDTAATAIRTVGRGAPAHSGWIPLAEHRPASTGPHVIVACFSDGCIDEFHAHVTAAAHLVQQGAQLWMTSADGSLVAADGTRRPGPGVFLAAVEMTLGRTLREDQLRVVGKGGAQGSFEAAARACLMAQGFCGDPHEVVMVGDRFDTDIRTGVRQGWTTCLVESGCHRLDQHGKLYPADVADMVAQSVGDLAAKQHAAGDIRDFVRDLLRTAFRYAPLPHDLPSWLARRLETLPTTLPRRVRSHPADLHALGEGEGNGGAPSPA